MANIKLTIAYDGSKYLGWQRQPQHHGSSIQQVLERALTSLLGNPVVVSGAGRTDSGVHAFGQVANFICDKPMPVERMVTVINRILPPDIRVLAAEAVDDDFHARFTRHHKRYRYLIERGERNNPFSNQYSWQLEDKLNLEAMDRASRALVGSHDFRHYTLSKVSATNFVREITEINIYEPEKQTMPTFFPWQELVNPLVIDITGNGFLYKMVRLMVGRLVAVGNKRISEEKIAEFLDGSFWRNIPPAPAQGLFLDQIWYEPKEE